MNKYLGVDLPEEQREELLKNSCVGARMISYTYEFTAEELLEQKDELSQVLIKIRQINEEKKKKMDEFKALLAPFDQRESQLIENIETGAETRTEACYKLVDMEERKVGYYNKAGVLVEERPAEQEELQGSIYN